MALAAKLLCAMACTTLAITLTAQQVKLDSGAIEGSTAAGITAYKGIPFAAPPVGALRWRAPQPVKPWTGVKQAKSYAADCMQVPFPSDAAPLGTEPAEDCLYANVWVPSTRPTAKLPVMVWIYGGGSVNGGSSPDVYSGEHFAKQGIVFVSFNYRLGRFGFFAHPALSAENADNGLLGNYAYMDEIAALKWVQRNAAAFGGDPANVTVFGESAGGRSVHMLLGTSLAEGLFQRAIIESGGGRGLGLPILSGRVPGGPPSGEETGLAFAKSVGVQGTGPEALAKLRALPAETIRGNLNMATSRQNIFSGNMIDSKIIMGTQADEYLSGQSAKVPLIIGTNSADAGAAAAETPEELFASFGTLAPQAKQAYTAPGVTLADMRAEVGRDRGMLEPARMVALTYAMRGIPVWEYRFSYVADSMRSTWKTGVPHATELPFVFDTVRAKYGDKTTPADEKAAEQILTYWSNFAKTGNPNGTGLPQWPMYTAGKDMMMNFTMDHGPVAEPDPWKARLDVTAAYNSQTPAVPVLPVPERAH